MAQQIINNGDSGLTARNDINNNFTELYGAVQLPVKISNFTSNQSVTIPANSFLLSGAGILISGTPSIKIGTTAGGADILPLTALTTTLNPAVFQQYFGALQILYITISGGGTASLRLDVINNYI